VGFVGVAAMIGWALLAQSTWIGIFAAFILLNCWSGLRHAQALLKIAKLPRRPGFACPSCGTAPPIGAYWGCAACRIRFDTFETGAMCPRCRAQFPTTRYLDCGRAYPLHEWAAAGAITVPARPVDRGAPVLPSTR